VLVLILGNIGAGQWALWLRWIHAQSFGISDPIFGRDVGFYVFSFPFWRFVANFLLGGTVVSTLAVGLVYAAAGGIRFDEKVKIMPRPLAHISALGGLFLLVTAWIYRLKIYTRVSWLTSQLFRLKTCLPLGKKTKKHFDKLILNPNVLKRLTQLSKNKPIVDGDKGYKSTTYAEMLREYYTDIGKIETNIKYKKGQDGWMFFNRPIYSIRHSAALMWMRRTAFNLELVAKMGWDDTKTLSKFYARTTVKNIMQAGTCYYCRPPKVETDEMLFCSAVHALAYLNGARK